MQAELEAALAEDSQLSAAAMTPELVYRVFEDRYVNPRPVFQVHECHFRQENGIIVDVTLNNGENGQTVTGRMMPALMPFFLAAATASMAARFVPP